MYTGGGMRKSKMFGLALAAAALVFTITAGQWKSEVSKTAGVVSEWLVRGASSIRDSETAHFIASWVAKEKDSIRDSYLARLVTGWIVSGTDAVQNVLTSTHPRTSTHPWTDASTSHQELQPLTKDIQRARSIPLTQPELAPEARGDEASAAPAVARAPEETRPDETSAPAAPPTATRRGLSSNEGAAYMALARSKIQQGDIAAARRLLERASDSDKAEAWFALAETYDPQMLARWGVLGVKPDPEKARTLYQTAEARGTQGARERLLALRK